MRRVLSIGALVAFGVGCSSSSGSTSNDGDSSVDAPNDEVDQDSTSIETSSEVSSDAPIDAGDATDGGACNDLAVPTSLVDEVQVASAPPTFTGGTIADGTYALTAQQKFTGTGGATGPDGIKVGQTLVFSGGTSVQSVATLVGAVGRWNAVYTAGGTDLALKATCGKIGGDPAIFSYSASSTELQLYVSAQGILETFTLK